MTESDMGVYDLTAFNQGGGRATNPTMLSVIPMQPEPTCPGDINGEGVVDGSDLLLLLSGWGSCP